MGVKSYSTQAVSSKSFSLEHKFYGRLNSSIDFCRGLGMTGGYIGINVDEGRQIAKFDYRGLDVRGIVLAREVRVENEGGAWARVLTSKGDQQIEGKLKLHSLDCEPSENSLRSVLARLPEGNEEGEGTYLGIRSHFSQKTTEQSIGKVKSFSLEHKFFGRLNSSIDFYRGLGMTGGYIGINVDEGRQIAKFDYRGLEVAGTVLAREVKVEISAGADHVFNNEYKLKPLSEVENFIKENKHLPEIQSEKQMQEEGLNINEFQIQLLQKIEELTLYVIQQEKKIEELQVTLLKK